jgi:hypothetical protein
MSEERAEIEDTFLKGGGGVGRRWSEGGGWWEGNEESFVVSYISTNGARLFGPIIGGWCCGEKSWTG